MRETSNLDVGWVREMGLEAALRAQAEYLDDPVASWREAGLDEPDEVYLHRVDESECSVATYADHHWVAYRGTEPGQLRDWLTDAMVKDVPLDGAAGKFHRGFLGATRKTWAPVMDAIGDGRPVRIVGHSLGGAMATDLACMILVHNAEAVGTRTPVVPIEFGMTFGSPRAMGRRAARWFEEQLGSAPWVRFVRNNDIVARVPAGKHVGSVAFIEHDGDLAIDPGRWQVFKDRVRGRVDALLGGEPTVYEVQGLRRDVADALVKAGKGRLRQVARLAVADLVGVAGVGPVIAERVLDWAAHRLAGRDLDAAAALFDGTHDHAIGLYVHNLRGQPAA